MSTPNGAPRLKLLCIGPQNVWPPIDGGKEGIHGALQGLAHHSDVVYAFPALTCDEVQREGYRRAGVDPIPVPWEVRESLTLVLSATANLKPYKFEKYSSSAAVRVFARAVPKQAFDAVVCFHAHTARLGEGLREALGWNVPVIVREHNIEYELIASYRQTQTVLLRTLGWPFEALTRRAEQRIWASADAVAFLSDRDLAVAEATGVQGRLLLAREGIPLPTRRTACHPGNTAPLLVLLNPKAMQSVLNLREFIQRNWSKAARDPRTAGITLDVTGVDTGRLATLVGMSVDQLLDLRVRGLGFLPSLDPVLGTALALVSPTYVGGGIRKKILEAMAHQLPVIATRFDIETCAYLRPGQNILELPDDPGRLGKMVETLRNDAALWHRLSDAARTTVETHASWELFATTLLEEIKRLVSARRSVGQPDCQP